MRSSRRNSLRTWASTSGGHLRRGDRCVDARDLLRVAAVLAELFLDRLELLLEQVTALPVVDMLFGAGTDLARQAQHL
jgi:hypothetical protein